MLVIVQWLTHPDASQRESFWKASEFQIIGLLLNSCYFNYLTPCVYLKVKQTCSFQTYNFTYNWLHYSRISKSIKLFWRLLVNWQKNSLDGIMQRRCSNNFEKFNVGVSFLRKLQWLVSKFIEKRLRDRCFPAAFWKNICERLHLNKSSLVYL